MGSVVPYIVGLVALYTLISIGVAVYQQQNGQIGNSRTLPGIVVDYHGANEHSFDDAAVAYEVLSQLDAFEPAKMYKNGKIRNGSASYGLKKDDNFCDNARAYFVDYPEVVFDEINFASSYHRASLLRSKALGGIANDVHPKVGDHMFKKGEPRIDLKPYTNMYFNKNPQYSKMMLGKHFSCISQASNHIPGRTSLDQKDNVAENAIKYAKNFIDRPQCFNHDKFFPETWLLRDAQDCKDFFKILNSQQYKDLKAERKIVYIRKVAAYSHRGEGVQPVNEQEEKALKKMYGNGDLCGKVSRNLIVQYYVHNPLLINNQKFDFRMYMLIGSTNPLLAFYHDGFLRVSLTKYDVNSNEKKALLTNLALNKQIYDDVKGGRLFEGMGEEELKFAQQWSFDRLQTYLLEKGIISDPNWLDNYLRPEFKKAMIHLLRLSFHTFHKDSTLFELHGVDFMLDDKLNLWFIEANSSPALYGYSQPMEKFIVKMLQDHFKVVMSLVRSRMLRVLNFVNLITREGQFERKGGKIIVKDLEAKRATFKQITMNYFEKEFELTPDNGFSKIYDNNLQGADKYLGFIDEECL